MIPEDKHHVSVHERNIHSEFRITTSDGRSMGYRQYGDSSGAAIIYCHGGISSSLDIEWCDKLCQSHKVRMIAVDRPGIGLSDRHPSHSLLDWAEDVRQLAEQLGLSRFAVLGWSLGSPYAIACGFAMPETVTRIGIVGGIGPITPAVIKSLGMEEDKWLLTYPSFMALPLRIMLQSLLLLPPALVKSSLLSHLNCASDRSIVNTMTPEYTARFFHEALRQGGSGILDDYTAVRKNWGFKLDELKPALLIWQGTDDNICPPSISRELHQQCRSAQLISVDGHGHFLLHRKLPEILDALVADC